ncbi:Cell division protein ftsB-like protein [Thiocapsa marina 5811]|uniref:Cell division protein FtsB n=2 Tax=Thiocapsa marina TaxID=244573 RepID=F9UBK9_9GAMM|nr:Cell division protein ftsB-like protein [Thiocapsa marina 5811]
MRVALPSSGFDGWRAGVAHVHPLLPKLKTPSMRLLILVLILLLAGLQFRLWVGEGSLAEVHGLKSEIAAQEEELIRLRARNQELQAEVMDLREGVEALEERARRDLGMIKPGEIFIQVIERKAQQTTPPEVKR